MLVGRVFTKETQEAPHTSAHTVSLFLPNSLELLSHKHPHEERRHRTTTTSGVGTDTLHTARS